MRGGNGRNHGHPPQPPRLVLNLKIGPDQHVVEDLRCDHGAETGAGISGRGGPGAECNVPDEGADGQSEKGYKDLGAEIPEGTKYRGKNNQSNRREDGGHERDPKYTSPERNVQPSDRATLSPATAAA